MYIDKRTYEVELPAIEEKTQYEYSYRGDYNKTLLYCKKCGSNLTRVFTEVEDNVRVNYCPHCGQDLKENVE